MSSVLVKSQKKSEVKTFEENGEKYRIKVDIRYDDECGNGHNTFAITGTITGPRGFYMGGCIHDEIKKHFPHLSPLIKWHLTSSDGPMHYLANTTYLASDRDYGERKDRELDAARRSAVWREATDTDLIATGLADRLRARLPALMAEFRAVIEGLGFIY